MKLQKKYLKFAGMILPLLLALACVITVSVRSHQASQPVPMPQSFIGEYSYDRENWFPLTADAEIPATEGDLYLRGCFEREMVEGQVLRYYRNHIGVTVFVNGERVYFDAVTETAGMGNRLFSSMCGREWAGFTVNGITPQDRVEIHLYNPHRLGNESAYRDFLTTLCGDVSGENLLQKTLERYGAPFRIAGGVFAIASLMILGAAVASVIVGIPAGGRLLGQGLMTLFAGGFIFFDAFDISCRSELVVLNTYGRQLCMMLAVLFAGQFAAGALTGRRRKTAEIALIVSAALDSALILAALLGWTVIFDTQPVWLISQMLLCPVLLVLCAMELFRAPKEKWLPPASGFALFAGILADSFGVGGNIVIQSPFSKVLFTVLFFIHIVNAARSIVRNHLESQRAKRLERELEDSRIAIMLSQIRPHFLYNVLGTIRGLCREEPMRAWQAMGDFSDYLRGNMSALANSRTIHFTGEFRHIEAYLRLEKMRMGERLNILYDIQEKDFFIPPLTIQPLVENAIKHGLFEKDSGTLILHTERSGDRILISVQDDGVGFDENAPLRQDEHHAHVGLSNVRSRLESICGGWLEIDSEPGRGTTATVIIPEAAGGNGGEDVNENTGR